MEPNIGTDKLDGSGLKVVRLYPKKPNNNQFTCEHITY